MPASLATLRALRILRALRAEGEAVPALMGPIVQSVTQLAALSAETARGGDLRAAMGQRASGFEAGAVQARTGRHDATDGKCLRSKPAASTGFPRGARQAMRGSRWNGC